MQRHARPYRADSDGETDEGSPVKVVRARKFPAVLEAAVPALPAVPGDDGATARPKTLAPDSRKLLSLAGTSRGAGVS